MKNDQIGTRYGAADTYNNSVQLRRDTASNWSSMNPVLKAGEIGFVIPNPVTNAWSFKIGDGVSRWNSLSAFSSGSVTPEDLAAAVSSYITDNPISAATYYTEPLTNSPWWQGDATFTATGHVYGVVTPTQDPYYRSATFHFQVEATVTGADGTESDPRMSVDILFRALDPTGFAGWAWGLNYGDPLRAPVYGELGGLPFTGYVDQNDNLLDADGVSIARTIQTGDYLCGTISGVFQND